jgi:3-deoxy-D-manno-octulosonate 8-phosphate phosphatase (KDO 8-P phosphatase)
MPPLTPDALTARARALRVLLFDVDGVMTDGGVYLDADGRELKRFSIKDGAALALAPKLGLMTGLVSARASAATSTRAEELGMAIVMQGVANKREALAGIMASHGVQAREIAYMGDDLVDLPILAAVGLAACPADAATEVRAAAHWVSAHPGGQGAVREFIEVVLQARGQWDDVLSQYA